MEWWQEKWDRHIKNVKDYVVRYEGDNTRPYMVHYKAEIEIDSELTRLRAEVERLRGIADDGAFHRELAEEGFGVTERMAICRILCRRAKGEG